MSVQSPLKTIELGFDPKRLGMSFSRFFLYYTIKFFQLNASVESSIELQRRWLSRSAFYNSLIAVRLLHSYSS